MLPYINMLFCTNFSAFSHHLFSLTFTNKNDTINSIKAEFSAYLLIGVRRNIQQIIEFFKEFFVKFHLFLLSCKSVFDTIKGEIYAKNQCKQEA